jgi:hypothetical protein
MSTGHLQLTVLGRALQGPSDATAMPLHSAMQALSNVTPSTVHTGSLVAGQSHWMLWAGFGTAYMMQGPLYSTVWLAQPAWHTLGYVFKSLPHTWVEDGEGCVVGQEHCLLEGGAGGAVVGQAPARLMGMKLHLQR